MKIGVMGRNCYQYFNTDCKLINQNQCYKQKEKKNAVTKCHKNCLNN